MERRSGHFLLTALAALALAAGSMGVTGYLLRDRIAQARAWNHLLSRPGQDLRKLEEVEVLRLERDMRVLAPPNVDPRDRSAQSAPSFVFTFHPAPGVERILILEESLFRSSHRECAVYVHVFDKDRRRISSSRFNAGWRSDVLAVRAVWSAEIGGDVLMVDAGDEQHYALVEDRPVLVRYGSQDESWRNHYHLPNIAVGEAIPLRSSEEWEKVLISGDVREQLQLLVWLGGYHMDPRIPPPENLYHEDDRLAALAWDLQERPSVRKRLTELSNSPNLWLRVAARLACDPQWQSP